MNYNILLLLPFFNIYLWDNSIVYNLRASFIDYIVIIDNLI